MNDFSNDPFDNEKVHQTICDPHSNLVEERTPFNDVVKHNDIIQGFQAPKNGEQIPRWFKNPLRIFAIISILIFFSTLLFQIVSIFTSE